MLESSPSKVGDGSLLLCSFLVLDFFLNRGSEASLDFCASDLGGGAVEAALSSVVPPAAALLLGTKLPAEHLLAAPSSFLYFLTLFMAFMADSGNTAQLLSSVGQLRIQYRQIINVHVKIASLGAEEATHTFHKHGRFF